MNYEIKTRHYNPSTEIIRRDARDISRTAEFEKAMGKSVLLDIESIKLTNPSLISSAHGPLNEVFLSVPKYAVENSESNPYWNVYKDLLKKLPSYTKFIIVTHEKVQEWLNTWIVDEQLEPSRFRITAVPDHLYFSVWAEDAYVIAKNKSTTYFVEPFSFPRYADSLLADAVNNATEYELTTAPLYFQGGNVLIGDDFFMIGADYPKNSLKYVGQGAVIIPNPGETPQALVKRLYNEYLDKNRKLLYVGSKLSVPSETVRDTVVNGEPWKEVIYFGNKEGTVQPLFHIDMFISLAGRDKSGQYQVLVGDPRLAYQVLNKPVPSFAMVEVFDNIARQFTDNGFKVVRNPLPMAYFDDTQAKERIWYFATSNNSLVEITQESKRVFLPTYGYGAWSELRDTDKKNKQIWEELGFDVVQLEDFHPFAENLGAVHCIKKYLSR